MKTVDVIIPTYKPGAEFLQILKCLKSQTIPVHKIIIMNTEESYWEQLVYGNREINEYRNMEIHHISRQEFDHGRTRNLGVKYSNADIFLMMTQDAIPADDRLIENIIKPLEKEEIVVSYGRQLPKADCSPIERFTRGFNYPDESRIKTKADEACLGIKTYFCSDVCAAYKRSVFLQLGGFVKPAIFNEDMLFAYKALQEGYAISYTADARVYHSHNYSPKEQFKRNFDLGVSQAEHKEVFDHLPSEGEGVRMVKATAKYLLQNGYGWQIMYLIRLSAAKYLGFRKGKNYSKLTKKKILTYTSNKYYWLHQGIKKESTVVDATKGYGRNEEKEGV